jgi:ribosomal protein S28E/S33
LAVTAVYVTGVDCRFEANEHTQMLEREKVRGELSQAKRRLLGNRDRLGP